MYPSEARIVCRIFGTTPNVNLTVGSRNANQQSHPVFNATDISRRLFAVPITATGNVPDNDRNACLAKATQFVANELPAAYTVVDNANAFALPAGHAWRDGHWVPTGNAAYVAYAFPLLRAGAALEDPGDFKDLAGVNAQLITLSWFVVIQPR